MPEPTQPATSGAEKDAGHGPVLDPINRLSEIMFGLLMTLTFTGTMSVAIGSGGDVRSVLFAALGCNLAWGIVDGTMHILTSLTERGRDLSRRRQITSAAPADARDLMRDALPDQTGRILTEDEVDRLVDWIKRVPDDGKPAVMAFQDIRAALAVFLLVVSATLPPVLPFILLDHVPTAMRLSNFIAVAMLFFIGWRLDQQMNQTAPWMRIVVPIMGCILVGVTIALGG
jgi:hypothetical protein